MSALTEVVSSLIDAAFTTGGITDAQQTELHAKLDAGDQPAEPAPEPAPDPEPTTPAAPAAPVFGSEASPYA